MSPFTIGVSETLIHDQEEVVDSFSKHHAFHCASSLDPALIKLLSKICEQAQFVPDTLKVGLRELETPNLAGNTLTLALNRTNFLRWLEVVTRCDTLDSVSGYVTQMSPENGHLTWHSDLNDLRRRLAITINLSPQPYEGGEFELRNKATGEVLRHKHEELGSVLVFAIEAGIEHRVLPVISGQRLVYAGWFHSLQALKRRSKS